jgi:hypothetical protein
MCCQREREGGCFCLFVCLFVRIYMCVVCIYMCVYGHVYIEQARRAAMGKRGAVCTVHMCVSVCEGWMAGWFISYTHTHMSNNRPTTLNDKTTGGAEGAVGGGGAVASAASLVPLFPLSKHTDLEGGAGLAGRDERRRWCALRFTPADRG